ncbi:FAD-dependent monooxygenase [Pseudonocardia kunmingensis]|uniref:2-polyprenyl-6-methoxyphenol hydroxylase-like FAD-dependent oxidoreductase n=1 Tax=Pseudonocardia kunmingensis TaxID=630975 RepID=A0A543DYG1_9PSEU|nr:FAD-dependent monooxygenase [Pseudonocardia kunmingensis]TQM14354.1 2-polyprenyl-6-methoxyphenol hydroxylase-like FAD-dependent oxidoreductase [Pseudonocardia kunmingensis]
MNILPLRGLRVLVSGAGVAGPSLAFWLSRYGATTTVVESARALRTSGFAVDFRGPTHLGVLAAMGVLDELRSVQTHGGASSCVDEHGREIFGLPAEFAGGDIEVRRRDLSRVLHDRSAERAEYLFGDSVTALTQTADGVHVDLARGASRTVDLVVGADGIHSGVRRLAFGDESRYVRHLGYHLAGWDLPTDAVADPRLRTTPQQYNVPGRMASVSLDDRDPERAGAFLVFAAPRLEYDPTDIDRQKELVAGAFAGVGWLVPQLLETLPGAAELYFDAISRVSVPRWSTGRVALLGDAATGVTLGGMGVGAAVVGAHVLAGELAAAQGDHRAAFAAYERRMRAYTGRWQRGAAPGEFLAPSTATRLWLRNALLRTRLVQRLLVASTRSIATELDLPAYPVPADEPGLAA